MPRSLKKRDHLYTLSLLKKVQVNLDSNKIKDSYQRHGQDASP